MRLKPDIQALTGMSRGELMKSIRKDAFEALLKANPLASRQVLRANSKRVALEWYGKILSGEIQFGVKIEGDNPDGEGQQQQPQLQSRGNTFRRGFRQRPRSKRR